MDVCMYANEYFFRATTIHVVFQGMFRSIQRKELKILQCQGIAREGDSFSSPTDQHKLLVFPRSREECLLRSAQGYMLVKIPKEWTRSRVQQNSVILFFCHKELKDWTGLWQNICVAYGDAAQGINKKSYEILIVWCVVGVGVAEALRGFVRRCRVQQKSYLELSW